MIQKYLPYFKQEMIKIAMRPSIVKPSLNTILRKPGLKGVSIGGKIRSSIVNRISKSEAPMGVA